MFAGFAFSKAKHRRLSFIILHSYFFISRTVSDYWSSVETADNAGPARAFLVGLRRQGEHEGYAEAMLDELRELVGTLGVEIGGEIIANLREINPRHLVGSGKMEEIAELAKESKCNLVVFDDELSPAQQRNWESDAKLRAIDRQEIILDIFASRASTKEAVLQVELARLQHQLPRLKRLWSHLDRQRGGGAMQRDAGEKQIEMDSRLLRERIAKVRRELDEVVAQRATQRKQRRRVPVPTVAIVGYTNAGKSSLLNRLTGAHVVAKDRLFETLDPTTRQLILPSGRKVLLTDTVGFVRRLPHKLVEAFKATLEEAVQADLLLHVVDISSPEYESHLETTHEVLAEIGAGERRSLPVFNKTDLVDDPVVLRYARELHPDAQLVSVRTGAGLDALLARIDAIIGESDEEFALVVPHDHYELVGRLHKEGVIHAEKFLDDGVHLEVVVPPRLRSLVEPYVVKE